MRFFDAFRKRPPTDEEVAEKIREIDRKIDAAHTRIAEEVETRLKKRFDAFWRFEESHVRGQLKTIEDLFYIGGENPKPAAAADADTTPEGEKTEAEPATNGERRTSEPVTDDDMKWVKSILWQVWRKDVGVCHRCQSDSEIHFVPGTEEEEPDLEPPDEPFDPSTIPGPEDPPETAEGGEGDAKPEEAAEGEVDKTEKAGEDDEEAEVEPPIHESVTRQIVSRLRLACVKCAGDGTSERLSEDDDDGDGAASASSETSGQGETEA